MTEATSANHSELQRQTCVIPGGPGALGPPLPVSVKQGINQAFHAETKVYRSSKQRRERFNWAPKCLATMIVVPVMMGLKLTIFSVLIFF